MRYKDILIILSTMLDCLLLVVVGLLVVGSSRLEKLSPYRGDQLEYIPIYPGARQVAIETRYTVANSGDTAIRTITFETSNNPRNIQNYYKNRLAEKGWMQTQYAHSSDYPVGSPLLFHKPMRESSNSLAPWDWPSRLSVSTNPTKQGLIHVEITQSASSLLIYRR